MNINHSTHGNVKVVQLPEQLIMANAPETRESIQHLIHEGHNRLILNLEDVSFIDSSGLSVLVSAMKAVHAGDGAIALLSPSDDVRSLIELTRLHQVFDIFEDRDAAVRKVS